MTTTTTIVRATFNTNFAALYMQRSALEKAINDASFTIGGENLLDNTSFTEDITGWASNGGTNTIVSQTVGNGATKCLSIVATAANQGIYRGLNNRYTATSATVTVSFWAKASAAGLTLRVASENHTGTSTVTLTTAWQYYSLTLTKTTANPNIVIYSGSAGTFYVSQLKYEKGAVATAWSPSTYELDASISSASSAASNAAILAGNKGEVIYGATAPTVAQRLSQNLWIDTTGNANTPKRWNGTAWVSVTDKAAIDAKTAADNAAALASAADNQLSLWKYPNTTQIDGGKIYTNSITANQIQVDDLSAISANLGTIQVGSANIEDLAITTAKIGDAQITTAKIGDLQVDTLKIMDDAVSVGVGVQGMSSITTISNGGKLRLDIGLQAYYSSTYIATTMGVRVLRNGAVIKTFSFPATYLGSEGLTRFSYTCALPPVMETIAAGTTVTYRLQITDYNGNWREAGSNVVWVGNSGLSMAVTELKK